MEPKDCKEVRKFKQESENFDKSYYEHLHTVNKQRMVQRAQTQKLKTCTKWNMHVQKPQLEVQTKLSQIDVKNQIEDLGTINMIKKDRANDC